MHDLLARMHMFVLEYLYDHMCLLHAVYPCACVHMFACVLCSCVHVWPHVFVPACDVCSLCAYMLVCMCSYVRCVLFRIRGTGHNRA